jgi:restriction endonuclease S subunit
MTEGPYTLPKGWRWAKLGEVCEVWQGKTPPKSTYVSKPTAIKVLKFRDITSEGDIIWDNTERGFLERNEGWRYAKIGDVLVTASAHFPDQIGKKVALLNFVPAEYSRVVVIPLPPLEEQRRIVARIEELMGRVREAQRLREEARNEAERLWQAILAQTFPRPGSELPEGWRWAKLGEVCDVERKTLDPRRFPEKEFFVYSIPAYDKNESPELLKGAEIGSAKLVIEPGVCLFSKLNPRIPRAWAIREDPPVPNTTLLASTEFMPLRPHSQLLDLEYLRTLLLSDIFLNQVRTDLQGPQAVGKD